MVVWRTSHQTTKADLSLDNNIEYHPPQDTVVKDITAWTHNGFIKQPDSVVNLYPGQKKILHTDTVQSDTDGNTLMQIINYQWLSTSNNGLNWNNDTAAGNNSADIEVVGQRNPNTRYFQLKTTWQNKNALLPSQTNRDIYSWSSQVNTVAKPVDTDSIAVTTDDDYLYNNQTYQDSTYVHAKLSPLDATGDVKWSSSDESIAKVDQFGKVMAVSGDGQPKKVKITATVKNSTGVSVSGSAEITVGGGLMDQKAAEGKSATFSIQSTQSADLDSIKSITWYRYNNDPTTAQDQKTPQVVQTGKSFQYTTTNTNTLSDNGASYYAVINYTNSKKTLRTNVANLTVYKTTNNLIYYSGQKITDQDNPAANKSNSELTDVKGSDNLVLSGNLFDRDEHSATDYGPLTFQVPANAKVTDLTLNGLTPKGLSYYTDQAGIKYIKTEKTDNPAIDKVVVPKIIFEDFGVKMYRLKFQLGQDRPYLNFQGHIDFGSLISSSSPIDKVGVVNDPNSEVLHVDDLRDQSDMGPAKIFISVDPILRDSDNQSLPAEFRLYGDDGRYQDIDGSGLVLKQTQQGEKIPSIYWKNKLFLHLPNSDVPSGHYQTKFTWTVTESV